jgi:GcrA cell cycle regulator
MSWTDERIEQLRAMWTKGMTASQIAEELGGVSRNAVIGKAHRLGLQSRPSPVKANDGEVAPARKPATPRTKPAPAAAPVAAPVAKAQPAPARPAAAPAMPSAPRSTNPDQMPPTIRSIGPGGFVRQNPGEQSSPPPPAPPRRLVPARPSPEISDKTSLLDLNDRICKWPLGHPGEPDFHFCGTKVNPGFPYCVDHCGLAYQAQMPRRDRKPLPFAVPGAKPSGG